MTSKEIIQRLVSHDAPPRFGFNFNQGENDILGVSSHRVINMPDNPYDAWGNYPELKALTGFHGEVRRDFYGNIYGRFEGKTKGECIRGVIEDWADYRFPLPEFDKNYRDELLSQNLADCSRYVMTGGGSLFSVLRDARLMTNALADTILEPEAVKAFIDMLADHEVSIINSISGCGIDCWALGDDWGTQTGTFISPACFRELFKPGYQKIFDAAHNAGMAVSMHSCGYNIGIMDDLLDAGVDLFQFDQPDAYPCEVLARDYAQKVVFYSPVDIQKVLPTGDRDFIETRTREMCELFRAAGGGWLAKDYPSYYDIGVEPEWAAWAQKIIVENSSLL